MDNIFYKQLEITGSAKAALDCRLTKGVEFMWRLYFLPNEKWTLTKRMKWEMSKSFRDSLSEDLSFTINGKLRMLFLNHTVEDVRSFEFENYIQSQLRSELREKLNLLYFDMFNIIEINEK